MFSTTAEYALRAAVFLAQHTDRPWTSQEIAEQVRVPALYLSKVLQQLAKAGIVHSQRGLGGGFTLKATPGKITVMDILDATGNPLQPIKECPLGLTDHVRLCSLHRMLDEAIRDIRKRFKAATLASLVSTTRRAPLCEEKVQLTRKKTKRK